MKVWVVEEYVGYSGEILAVCADETTAVQYIFGRWREYRKTGARADIEHAGHSYRSGPYQWYYTEHQVITELEQD